QIANEAVLARPLTAPPALPAAPATKQGPLVTRNDAPVTVALVGAGNRGQTYARWIAAHPDRARLVAVADPRPFQRSLVASGSAAANPDAAPVAEFADWESLVAAGDDTAGAPARLADMVIVATQDREHRDPVVALTAQGYA